MDIYNCRYIKDIIDVFNKKKYAMLKQGMFLFVLIITFFKKGDGFDSFLYIMHPEYAGTIYQSDYIDGSSPI